MVERYHKTGLLGIGGFGKCFQCEDSSNQTNVVMKEIEIGGLPDSEQKKIFEESNILSTMNHPNIIRCLGTQIEHDRFQILMEYADGGNLEQKIQE